MNAILRKTESGLQALQVREGTARLPVRLRTLLLQVDSQKSRQQLGELAISLGNTADIVDKLLEMGLVEIVPGSELATEAAPVVEATPPPAVAVSAPSAPVKIEPPVLLDEEEQPVAQEDLPVSAKLPEHLRPVAALMRKLVEIHLGIKAMLLKRRISHCDTEAELRLALVALREALGKASNTAKADTILQEVYVHLPMIGLNRPKSF
ncbi:hypothetical protein FNU76_02690 [Chitinimonas arctica]|uniref:Uncharacterized protein n=1 Tax=Chitinimonas arctica TaxID=2594795 RepID=A0A516SB23_9NEIS|nr:hypothetical protein [Chitinimonas arctica]QDQ25350.1 hypothetical protein FNU76_02690 [Chitinimonas arctica]